MTLFTSRKIPPKNGNQNPKPPARNTQGHLMHLNPFLHLNTLSSIFHNLQYQHPQHTCTQTAEAREASGPKREYPTVCTSRFSGTMKWIRQNQQVTLCLDAKYSHPATLPLEERIYTVEIIKREEKGTLAIFKANTGIFGIALLYHLTIKGSAIKPLPTRATESFKQRICRNAHRAVGLNDIIMGLINNMHTLNDEGWTPRTPRIDLENDSVTLVWEFSNGHSVSAHPLHGLTDSQRFFVRTSTQTPNPPEPVNAYAMLSILKKTRTEATEK